MKRMHDRRVVTLCQKTGTSITVLVDSAQAVRTAPRIFTDQDTSAEMDPNAKFDQVPESSKRHENKTRGDMTATERDLDQARTQPAAAEANIPDLNWDDLPKGRPSLAAGSATKGSFSGGGLWTNVDRLYIATEAQTRAVTWLVANVGVPLRELPERDPTTEALLGDASKRHAVAKRRRL